MATKQVSKLDKARTQIVLDHPFVSSILLRHPLIARDDIPTLGVDRRGQIFYNPKFIDTLTVPEIVWGLSHEVFHRIGQHGRRMGSRNAKGWNIACDAWINDTLDRAKIGTRIGNTVNMPGSADDTCENIYDKLPKNGSGDKPGDQPGDQPGGHDGIGDDLLDEGKPPTESEEKELEAEIKIEVAEAMQAAKMRGKLSAALAEFAADIIEVKTPWYEILEQHMTARVKQDRTWARANRRYEDVHMPSYGSVPQMGELAIQVDISGSVSQQEIKHYNGHLSRIVEQCNPTKVHVIYTDTQVQKYQVFEQGEEVSIQFYSGGGTDMCAGIQYMKDHGIDPEVFVTLTDGYTDFPAREEFPSIWCISSNIKAPAHAGETIHFEMTR